jgi:hypothetical protein
MDVWSEGRLAMNDSELAAFEGFQFRVGQTVIHSCSNYPADGEETGIVVERLLADTPYGIQRSYLVSFPKGRDIYYPLELASL